MYYSKERGVRTLQKKRRTTIYSIRGNSSHLNSREESEFIVAWQFHFVGFSVDIVLLL